MIIYRDVITGDEMFSDTFKINELEFFYEVEGKSVIRTEGFDDALFGANASAEETPEGTESNSVSGVDIILNHSLQKTEFTKSSFLVYIKEYVKALKAKLEEDNPSRVDAFVVSAPIAVKKILAKFKDYEFFTGESSNPEGMVGMLDYREDGITPYMLFLKDGLVSEKC